MSLTAEVYLKCDSMRCSEKVAYHLPLDSSVSVGESFIVAELKDLAWKEGWISLGSTNLTPDGEARRFHSEKCVRDFLVDKRKRDMAANEEMNDDVV